MTTPSSGSIMEATRRFYPGHCVRVYSPANLDWWKSEVERKMKPQNPPDIAEPVGLQCRAFRQNVKKRSKFHPCRVSCALRISDLTAEWSSPIPRLCASENMSNASKWTSPALAASHASYLPDEVDRVVWTSRASHALVTVLPGLVLLDLCYTYLPTYIHAYRFHFCRIFSDASSHVRVRNHATTLSTANGQGWEESQRRTLNRTSFTSEHVNSVSIHS